MSDSDLSTYLAQIDAAAEKAGVDVAQACEAEGIARTTLQRWRKGEVSPREATAQAVLKRITLIAEEKRAA